MALFIPSHLLLYVRGETAENRVVPRGGKCFCSDHQYGRCDVTSKLTIVKLAVNEATELTGL